MPANASAGYVLSIGAIARSSGVPAATLRSWEARFGRPVPRRLQSGHRRYSEQQAQWATLVAQAIRRGLRTSDAVPLSAAELTEWLSNCTARASNSPVTQALRDAAAQFDGPRVSHTLERVLVENDLEHLLDEVLDPFLLDLQTAQLTNSRAEIEGSFVRQAVEQFLLARCHVMDREGTRPRILVCGMTPELVRLRLVMLSAAAQRAGFRSLRIDPCQTPTVLLETARAARVEGIVVAMSVDEPIELSRSRLRELATAKSDPSFPVLLCGDVVAPGSGRNLADIERVRSYSEAVRWMRGLQVQTD